MEQAKYDHLCNSVFFRVWQNPHDEHMDIAYLGFDHMDTQKSLFDDLMLKRPGIPMHYDNRTEVIEMRNALLPTIVVYVPSVDRAFILHDFSEHKVLTGDSYRYLAAWFTYRCKSRQTMEAEMSLCLNPVTNKPVTMVSSPIPGTKFTVMTIVESLAMTHADSIEIAEWYIQYCNGKLSGPEADAKMQQSFILMLQKRNNPETYESYINAFIF